jgi:predicted AlkP superfamily phosphohydrolase/phosphomutase
MGFLADFCGDQVGLRILAAFSSQQRKMNRLGIALFLSSLALASGCKRSLQDYTPKDRRVLLVGIDGADRGILDQMMQRNMLPALASLAPRTVEITIGSELREVWNPVAVSIESARTWTSLATGYAAQEHGVESSAVRVQKSYDQVPITSLHRRKLAVWETLSHFGVKVAVVGWWTTWPAEWVEGSLVSDRFFLHRFDVGPFASHGRPDLWQLPPSYGQDAQYLTYPDGLTDSLAAHLQGLPEPAEEAFQYLRDLRAGADAEIQKDLDQVLGALRRDWMVKESLLKLLRDEPQTELAACFFDALDVACHLFWMYADPGPWEQSRDPLVRQRLPQDYARYAEVLFRVAATLDFFLGQLVTQMGQEAAVLVVSDHGFAAHAEPGNRHYNLNQLFEKLGLLVRAEDGSVDYSKTRCWDWPAAPWNFIRTASMNFSPDYPDGFVAAEDSGARVQVWDEIVAQLNQIQTNHSWRNPQTGRNGNGLFLGQIRVPWDMDFGVYHQFPSKTQVRIQGQTFALDELFPPRRQTGRHDQGGFLRVTLPGAEGERAAQRAAPIGQGYIMPRHLAPTVLALFGLPRAESEMENLAKPVLWVFDRDLGQRLSIYTVPSLEEPVGRKNPDTAIGERHAMLANYLEELGYWSAASEQPE